ncbi:uncharacterized protein LOC111930744 [Cyanistes caeruleus]|uniref:uncharacterized protein LOC111930744 n=1 Tax=Cyanistes caeruleus TaxID=156563 RepID=UPI000CDAC987|nr:uncharacterized protein LOC111930744 [Cyanistes caeruleus]
MYTVAIAIKQIYKVPLDAYSPIGHRLSAFLIGRSSSIIKGIYVRLEIIDADYLGQIHAMVSVSEPPVIILKGIAQLDAFVSCVPNTVNRSGGTGGFGSTGAPRVFWTQKVTEKCLERTCVITAKGHHAETITITGAPSHIKTDNGPAYVSQKLQMVFCIWGIDHSTGIPHASMGQAITETAHGVLKLQNEKQKGGMQQEPPQVRLDKAVYVLNF